MTQELKTAERPAESDIISISPETTAVASAVTREEMEVKTCMMIAQQFPRSMAEVSAELQDACARPAFAEGAAYAFPRGGSTITGPSVKLARLAGALYRHIRLAQQVISVDDHYIHIRVIAQDVQNNVAVAAEDKFERKIYRKSSGWTKPDERDLRELVNRRTALLERNALLKLIPPHLIDEGLDTCRKTIQAAAKGELQQSRTDVIRRLEVAFREFGVNRERLERYLAHPMEEVTEAEVGELRGIYRSILDGNTRASEHFPVPKRRPKRNPALGEAVEMAKPEELTKAELVSSLQKVDPKYLPVDFDITTLEECNLDRLRDLYGQVLFIMGGDDKADKK